MSIPVGQQVVIVNPGVVTTGSNPLALNAVLLTPNANAPVNEILRCYDAQDAADYFGTNSTEYTAAVHYFSANTVRNRLTPDSLFFTRYTGGTTAVPVAAWARGSSLAGMKLSELQAVTGSLSVTIDGVEYASESVNLSSVTSFTEAAETLATQLNLAEGQSFAWNSLFSRFEITSGATGENSQIGSVSGGAAEALGLADAQLSQGSNGITATEAIQAAADKNHNWALFSIIYENNVVDANAVEALAKWQAGANNRYFFAFWDNDESAKTAGDTTSIGYQMYSNGYSVLPIYGNITHVAAAMGCFASINWNAINGRITLAFKSQEGLEPSVTDLATAKNLLNNGYSYYGAYHADGANTYNFFYDGRIGSDWKWSDAYVNQIFLNAQLRGALITLLLGVNTLPYNDLGKTQIIAACTDVINQALTNGTIRTGITLSENQKAQIIAMVGFDVSNELYANGYYIRVDDASAQTRGQRQSPPIYFLYCDGGSIQQITLPSICVL